MSGTTKQLQHTKHLQSTNKQPQQTTKEQQQQKQQPRAAAAADHLAPKEMPHTMFKRRSDASRDNTREKKQRNSSQAWKFYCPLYILIIGPTTGLPKVWTSPMNCHFMKIAFSLLQTCFHLHAKIIANRLFAGLDESYINYNLNLERVGAHPTETTFLVRRTQTASNPLPSFRNWKLLTRFDRLQQGFRRLLGPDHHPGYFKSNKRSFVRSSHG